MSQLKKIKIKNRDYNRNKNWRSNLIFGIVLILVLYNPSLAFKIEGIFIPEFRIKIYFIHTKWYSFV